MEQKELENRIQKQIHKRKHGLTLLVASFGLIASYLAWAEDPMLSAPAAEKQNKKILYPKRTELSFDGTQIEGEIQSPGEFYFQHRPEEKFDSLIKRRKNFHREMMRDVVFSK